MQTCTNIAHSVTRMHAHTSHHTKRPKGTANPAPAPERTQYQQCRQCKSCPAELSAEHHPCARVVKGRLPLGACCSRRRSARSTHSAALTRLQRQQRAPCARAAAAGLLPHHQPPTRWSAGMVMGGMLATPQTAGLRYLAVTL